MKWFRLMTWAPRARPTARRRAPPQGRRVHEVPGRLVLPVEIHTLYPHVEALQDLRAGSAVDLAGPRTTIAAAEAAGETLEVRDRGGIVAHVAIAGPRATQWQALAPPSLPLKSLKRPWKPKIAEASSLMSRWQALTLPSLLQKPLKRPMKSEIAEASSLTSRSHVLAPPRLPLKRYWKSKIAEASSLTSR